jgi:hypothetical protein
MWVIRSEIKGGRITSCTSLGKRAMMRDSRISEALIGDISLSSPPRKERVLPMKARTYIRDKAYALGSSIHSRPQAVAQKVPDRL